MTATSESLLVPFALRLGDDALILGQRLGEWCGHAPTIEVDLALTNLSLDLIGQATLFLDYAGKLEGKGRDADRLAFRRDAVDFTNCLLVEQPNGDFAQTIARQFLYSTWQQLYLNALADSADDTLAAAAVKCVKEVAYHARFAAEWVVRLGDGTEESHRRMSAGLDWMSRFVDELFEMEEADRALLAAGAGVDKAALRPAWDAEVARVLKEAMLEALPQRRTLTGGRLGRHTEHLGHILSEMQFLQRAYPDAVW
ncbi:MAG: phenylacetate-CoA oxygenase subunit PaaC [Alphaproteobacteria bacterium]|nr:phenylacetate-CoA oxygenase subunit PaaC [Alphaproteobacteria bacterium]MBU6473847.1 phenylacetate-CoA oxygenase subunit PaaC [Alphaproteobacteria bacterium]MDE2014054.1 phenylacetate-CoA oxygenase subunit PaaC [Alphaproteobacteria bacterium]MDE2071989.1 phenylacetate-CoA oxygenase subunit PaaC [Alphaproteobacteria bacterium]MDE2352967.1 phenylacetate-CoA oxygenase subunit PaaC [Alphaproteobacteria bacterium]